jgi:5-amino-6-(5-phospho-D-ribitylamino)uracil phosphatase
MSIRLIAVDLDGTLLNSRAEVSAANRKALAHAAALGLQIVVVTGRRYHSARPLVAQIPCPVTLISSNGARIGTSSGQVFYRDFLSRSIARQVLEIALPHRPYTVLIFDVAGCGQVVMHHDAAEDSPLAWYRKNSPECLVQVPDLPAALVEDPIQVMFGGPPDRIEPIEPLLRASPAASLVHLTWTKYLTRNVSLLDCMNLGCTKGRALALWSQRCGISPSEVMAIGDNYNDREMLEFAGYPFLMGNRCEGLDNARWQRTLSNDEDGVAAAIREYVLKKESGDSSQESGVERKNCQ